jgi:hypothetical protein
VEPRPFEPGLALALGRRARDAWVRGAGTFAVPEVSDAALHIASTGPTAELRAEAARWLEGAASYHELVRLCARTALALEGTLPSAQAVYVPKVGGELEPALALWPHVLVVPTTVELSESALVTLRAFPVHLLGLRARPAWADGRLCSPGEFFFHDLDHARYKVREDLRALGREIPDPYVDGTTIDPATGRHRAILPAAAAQVGPDLWEAALERQALADRLLRATAALADRVLAAAADTLLFEIIHEKSFPLLPAILRRELASPAHLEKLRRKLATGFFGAGGPDPSIAGALEGARSFLLEAL